MSTSLQTNDGFAKPWRTLGERYGERPVMIWDEDGSAFAAADVHSLADAFAAKVARSVSPGGVVAICGPARPESLIACWGTWLAGRVVAAVDPARDRGFVAAALARCKPQLFLCASKALAGAAPPSAETCLFEDLPELLAAAGNAARASANTVADDAPGAILFTSGSSGLPKGVVLSRRGLWGSARVLIQTYGWGRDDRLLCTAGLHSMSGLRNPAVAAPLAGTTIVLENSPVHARPTVVADACRRQAVTVLTTAPAMLPPLSVSLRPDASRLRMVLSTGAPLFGDVACRIESKLGVPIYDYYGLTETSGACIMVTPDMHPAAPGVIGRAVDCAARIVREDGAECAPGELGELAVSSERLMLGYLDDGAATAAVLRDGWFYTGDMAVMDRNGAITLRGRRDDRIKTRSGDILYPAEVEAKLLACPAVRDVHVRPERGADAEARLDLLVVPADPHAELADVTAAVRQHLKNHGMTGITIGKVAVCDAIPRTGHGKIDQERVQDISGRRGQ